MKFSLILPVYNVENYLSQCIESCLHQDIPNEDYEIIVVIDGSPDNSLEIAQYYLKKNHNIKIIEQENRGISSARNTGLQNAQGEYLWFIDSDDYIQENILKSLYLICKENKLQALWLQWYEICGGKKKNIDKYIRKCNNMSIMNGLDFMEKVMRTCYYSWSFIYDTKYLKDNSFFFQENLIFEDSCFAIEYLPQFSRIKLCTIHCYNYVIRNSGLTRQYNPRRIKSLFIVFSKCIHAYKQYDKDLFLDCATVFFISFLRDACQGNNITELTRLDDLIHSNHIKLPVKGKPIYKFLLIIYRLSHNMQLTYQVCKFLSLIRFYIIKKLIKKESLKNIYNSFLK